MAAGLVVASLLAIALGLAFWRGVI